MREVRRIVRDLLAREDHVLVQLRCAKCNAFVPICAATDTPDVLVEIRAAEIAALELRVGSTTHTIRDGIVPYGMSMVEDEGWFSAEMDTGSVLNEDVEERAAGRRAGWLAYAITHHDMCGAVGVDLEGHCTRCGLVPEDGTDCPPGFLMRGAA